MVKFWSRTFAAIVAFSAMTVGAFAQTTQPFPSRTVTILVGFAPGGGGDTAMRWVADYLGKRWKVPVIVENKAGAGATIATGMLAKAAPDGYTVALVTTSPLTVAPFFQPVTYDPTKDFTYLFQFLTSAEPLFVRSDSPFNTIQELMAWAKANPNKLFWSSAATRGATQIATEAAFRAAGIKATYVPYKGGTEPIMALLSGQVQAVLTDSFPPFAAAGTIRLLAESGPDKLPTYPDLPTFKELGFPVSVRTFYGVAGPAGMPSETIRQWELAGNDMVHSPGFASLIAKLNSTPAYMDRAEFTASVIELHRQMGQLIPELGMKKD